MRFAIGAADAESAAAGLKPFEQLSGLKVELVPIPDDSFYDKAVAEFISGNASFDALQFFSPWLGDFAAPGFLAPLDEYAAKWGLPLDDFYDTYLLNYGKIANAGLYGIPFDCDLRMIHLRKSMVEEVLGGPVDVAKSVPTYDDFVKLTGELNKLKPGVAGVGLMGARGFWATYTWEDIAAQHGVMLFDDDFNPTLNSEAGVKAMEVFLALQKNAIEGVSGAGWGENRAAWLGGQVASNVSWQDSGTQASRPDQSQIVGDSISIFPPRVEGGRFAPTNVAGSTSCVAASSQNPEGAFLMLAFLTTASIMAMNEANANGVAPGYRSVLGNPNLQAVSPPSKVWAACLEHAWCAPRIPGHVRDGAGARQRDQPRPRRADLGQGGARQRQRRLEEDHGEERLLLRQRALHLCRLQARCLGRRRQAAAVLMAETGALPRAGAGSAAPERAGRSRGGARRCAGRCPTCWWRRRWSIS